MILIDIDKEDTGPVKKNKVFEMSPISPHPLNMAFPWHFLFLRQGLMIIGWPQIHCVVRADLELTSLQNTGIAGVHHHAQFIQYWAWTPWPQTCSASILPTLYTQPKFQELKLKDSWRFPDLQANMPNRACMSAWVKTETNCARHCPVPVCSLAVYCVVYMCSLHSVTELGWGAKVWMRWCL